MNLKAAVIALTLAARSLPAQETTPRPEFDIASIRPSRLARNGGEGSGRERVAVTPQSVTIENAGLSFCIQWAYNVKFYQVTGPQSLVSERYDIIAKTARPSSKKDLMMMTQALLADRFKLRFHRQTRTMPVYELIAPVRAAKLTPAAPPTESNAESNVLAVVNGSFVFRRVTMPQFAERLSDFSAFDRPVIDKTGIEGPYDITLESAASAMRNDPESIFSAVERVGLRLNPRKGPVEILVVDHAEKPSAN